MQYFLDSVFSCVQLVIRQEAAQDSGKSMDKEPHEDLLNQDTH